MFNFNYEKFTYNFDSISLLNFNLSVQSKQLFVNSNLTLSYGSRYGLVGKNGIGKSSLLQQLSSICDQDKLRILYVEQDLVFDERNPVQYILDSNIKLKHYQDEVDLLNELIETDENAYERLIEAERNLSSYKPEKEEALIKKILSGLGFNQHTMKQESNIFSGGYKMRIGIARGLYLEPDVLLLDEPSNHLDLEAIIWLSNYLSSFKKIAVIVSHNIGFINDSCTHILNIENQKIEQYRGNYDKFKKNYDKKLVELAKNYEKYEKKLKDAKKKGGSKKQLEEFAKKHFVPRPEKDYVINLQFFPIQKRSTSYIEFENVSFSYGDNHILDDISFKLNCSDKIVLVGKNGSGKSTIFKLIIDKIKPSSGSVTVNSMKIGYYDQHFNENLPLDKTPVEYLSDYLIDTNKIRELLGKIKLQSKSHVKLISTLSGGERARVALIKMTLEKPDFILADEISNHVDIETIEAIIDAFESFNGGLLLITHDTELIKRINSRLWFLNEKKIETGLDLDKYCDIILDETS